MEGTLGVPPPDTGVLVSDEDESLRDLLVDLDESFDELRELEGVYDLPLLCLLRWWS